MNYKNYIKNIAIFLSLLVISLPIIFAEEFSRTYDANGNLVSDGKSYREYNGLNQLVRVRLGNTSTSPILEEYKWHPIEERIVIKRVFSNGVLNYTVYYPNENFIQIVNSSGTFTEKYVYQDGILVAQVNTDGQKQAIHGDHEGSNLLITDSSGNVVENTFFSPYGEILEGGKNSRYGYEAKEYDPIVEDIDFKFRKYNPKQPPIFNQPDTLIKNVYEPQSLNRYSFERNNPLKNTDPTGHVIPLFGAMLIGGVVGATISTIWQLSTKPLSEFSGKRVLEATAIGAGIPLLTAALPVSSAIAASFGGGVANEIAIEVNLNMIYSILGEIVKDKEEKENEFEDKDFIIKPKELGTQVPPYAQTSNLMSNYYRNFMSNVNQNYYIQQQQINNLLQQMRREGSSKAVFGGGGGSGFVPGVGYVTSGGRTYPTTNPNFRPNPNVPRVCISGC